MTEWGATRRIMHIEGGRGERVSGPTEIEGVMAGMDGGKNGGSR